MCGQSWPNRLGVAVGADAALPMGRDPLPPAALPRAGARRATRLAAPHLGQELVEGAERSEGQLVPLTRLAGVQGDYNPTRLVAGVVAHRRRRENRRRDRLLSVVVPSSPGERVHLRNGTRWSGSSFAASSKRARIEVCIDGRFSSKRRSNLVSCGLRCWGGGRRRRPAHGVGNISTPVRVPAATLAVNTLAGLPRPRGVAVSVTLPGGMLSNEMSPLDEVPASVTPSTLTPPASLRLVVTCTRPPEPRQS